MLLTGVSWAMFAPALGIPMIWGIAQLLKGLGGPPSHQRLRRMPLRSERQELTALESNCPLRRRRTASHS